MLNINPASALETVHSPPCPVSWPQSQLGGELIIMESLPPPSELVEDEWAAMKIRFSKEGLVWDKLSPEDRILQVSLQ